MKRAAPVKYLLISSLFGVLSACSTDTPETVEPAKSQPAQATVPAVKQPPALSAHQRELSGSLLNIPAAAEVELALVAVDQRGIPRTLLSDIRLRGTGTPLKFHLPFNPEDFRQYAKVELRGRANQSGRLILSLPPQTIRTADTQVIGALSLVPAP